ncbi:hypothetical protein [Streptomyces rhizosphaericus]|uniref:Uncharacterized protein n=1 Tax=Streptomyces rhizosphaericus TaxID=114699 RepID=A0A6G4AKD2_9ACTN|nr:hypothetical protein [Streptomyces rhizosphaericus]NEW73702.1 hypothetical protein [Streptomyces rhizosphaericus]
MTTMSAESATKVRVRTGTLLTVSSVRTSALRMSWVISYAVPSSEPDTLRNVSPPSAIG